MPVMLMRIGVLELVDQNALKSTRERLADLFVSSQEIARRIEKIVEIEQRGRVFVSAPVGQEPAHRSGDAREKLSCNARHKLFERIMTGFILLVRCMVRLDAFGS